MALSSNSGGPRLCVAVIVRNAAEALEATLKSIASIADEIVVLDTGSADDTLAIAQRYQAITAQFKWADDFSAARNTCLKHVLADWVLWLDAGETMTSDDAQQLRHFVKNREAILSKAYAMLIKVPPQPGSIAGEQVARIRLMPNLPGVHFSGRVRESLAPTLESFGIQVDGLPYRIHRGAREHDDQLKVRRARRNLILADLEIKEKGPNARLLTCIGDALQGLGDNKNAAEFFRQGVQFATRGSTDMLEAYYGWITTFNGDAASREAQISICLKALEVYPLDAQLMCAMGGYLHAQGRLDLALRAYQTASQYGQINPETWHLDEIREIASVCQSVVLQLQNQFDDAVNVLESAAKQSPGSLRLHRQLIDLHVKAGRRKEAIAQTQLLPPETPNVEAYRIAIRGACLAQAKNWIGACAYLETAYKAGCRESLCLRWFTLTLIALNHLETARPVLQLWLEMEPNNAEALSYSKSLSPAAIPAATVTADSSTLSTGGDIIRRVDRADAGDTAPTIAPSVRTSQEMSAMPKQS